jgi:hypothetical protein
MSRRHASADSAVILAAELRRKLNNVGKQRFYAMVRAGRFRHLESPAASAVLGYTVYSKALVEEWIDRAPALSLAKRA